MSNNSLTKRLGAAALAALTAVSLTACAGGSTSDGGSTGGGNGGDENKIVFWPTTRVTPATSSWNSSRRLRRKTRI